MVDVKVRHWEYIYWKHIWWEGLRVKNRSSECYFWFLAVRYQISFIVIIIAEYNQITLVIIFINALEKHFSACIRVHSLEINCLHPNPVFVTWLPDYTGQLNLNLPHLFICKTGTKTVLLYWIDVRIDGANIYKLHRTLSSIESVLFE